MPPSQQDWALQLRTSIAELNQLEGLDKEFYLGDNPLEKFTFTEQATSWDKFLHWLKELKGTWCFRGQHESSWSLSTSLDRAARVDFSDARGNGYWHLERESTQRELLFRFQQQAHSHIHPLPAIDDIASWLTLMQHYGVPTRLLDWSKSPYVALFFALVDEQQDEEGCSALWAIDLRWLEKKECDFFDSVTSTSILDDFKRAKYLNDFLNDGQKNKKAVIVQINPLRNNDRMVAQQGIFLCKLYHEVYFGRTLVHMMSDEDVPNEPVLRKLTIHKSLRINFLKELHKMNIHNASLYPGLDGLGKSLKLDLEIKTQSERDLQRAL